MKKYLIISIIFSWAILIGYSSALPEEDVKEKAGIEKTIIRVPGWNWQDQFNFSQGVKAKGRTFVFLSGQGAMDSKGNVVSSGDFKAQAKQAWENIITVLKAAGASLDNIVWTTTYVTDMRYIHEVTEVCGNYCKTNPPPSTLVAVKDLAIPGMMIEIVAIAVLE